MKLQRLLIAWLLISFTVTSVVGPRPAQAAELSTLDLPQPGRMVNISAAYDPPVIKGLSIHQDNPLMFDFIVDPGQGKMSGKDLKKEGTKLIKYFLAALAISSKDLWVNLSPYEKDRTVPEALGQTEMGRDLLMQDYILKQLTASMIYPEKELGKKFWDRVYSKAQELYGVTQVPVNTFNKVWIMADQAEVFERNNTVFVTKSHLKVMLEEDYLATVKNNAGSGLKSFPVAKNQIGSQVLREIVIPELEHEVNTGKNFANLRQIFNSIILASWYKKNLKEAFLNQVYSDKNKISGVGNGRERSKREAGLIYQQYLAAYKKGVFNYIKDEINSNGQNIPRKYFSGGLTPGAAADPAVKHDAVFLAAALPERTLMSFRTGMSDKAMLTDDEDDKPQLISVTPSGAVPWTEAVDLMKEALKQPQFTDLIGLISINDQKEVLMSIGDDGYKLNHNGLHSRLGKEGSKGDYVYLMRNTEDGISFDLAPPTGLMGHLSQDYYDFHRLDQDGFETLPDHFLYMRDELILVCRLIQDAYDQLPAQEQRKYQGDKGILKIGLISKRVFSKEEQELLQAKERQGLMISDIAAFKLSSEDKAMSVEVFMNKVLEVLKGQVKAQDAFYAFLIKELTGWHDQVLPTEPPANINKEEVLSYLRKVQEGMDAVDRDEFNKFLIGDAVRFLERELLIGQITGDQLSSSIQQQIRGLIKRIKRNGAVDTVIHSKLTYAAMAVVIVLTAVNLLNQRASEQALRQLKEEIRRSNQESVLLSSLDWAKLRKVWSRPKLREEFLMSLASDYIDWYLKDNGIKNTGRKTIALYELKKGLSQWLKGKEADAMTMKLFFERIRELLVVKHPHGRERMYAKQGNNVPFTLASLPMRSLGLAGSDPQIFLDKKIPAAADLAMSAERFRSLKEMLEEKDIKDPMLYMRLMYMFWKWNGIGIPMKYKDVSDDMLQDNTFITGFLSSFNRLTKKDITAFSGYVALIETPDFDSDEIEYALWDIHRSLERIALDAIGIDEIIQHLPAGGSKAKRLDAFEQGIRGYVEIPSIAIFHGKLRHFLYDWAQKEFQPMTALDPTMLDPMTLKGLEAHVKRMESSEDWPYWQNAVEVVRQIIEGAEDGGKASRSMKVNEVTFLGSDRIRVVLPDGRQDLLLNKDREGFRLGDLTLWNGSSLMFSNYDGESIGLTYENGNLTVINNFAGQLKVNGRVIASGDDKNIKMDQEQDIQIEMEGYEPIILQSAPHGVVLKPYHMLEQQMILTVSYGQDPDIPEDLEIGVIEGQLTLTCPSDEEEHDPHVKVFYEDAAMTSGSQPSVQAVNQNTREWIVSGAQLTDDQRKQLVMLKDKKQAELMQMAQDYQHEYPELDWKNAALVEWSELVRAGSKQQPDREEAQRYGGELNQWHYWINQIEVRKIFFRMFAQIIQGKLTAVGYKSILRDIHRTLLTGETGQRWYWPETLVNVIKDSDWKYDPQRLAGRFYSEFEEGSSTQEITEERASHIVDQMKSSLSEQLTNSQLFSQITLIANNLRAQRIFFHGNMSIRIPMINVILKLKKLRTIEPTATDSNLASLLMIANMKPVDAFPGGIDLNVDTIQWHVDKEGQGVSMKVDEALFERFKNRDFTGLYPVVFKITPISSVWPLVGLNPPLKREELALTK